MNRPRWMPLLSERRRDSADAALTELRYRTLVLARWESCSYGADSNPHADASAEMTSVSKVPLAASERRDAANASERSQIHIHFP